MTDRRRTDGASLFAIGALALAAAALVATAFLAARSGPDAAATSPAAASGDVLLFLHADSLLPGDADAATIAAAIGSKGPAPTPTTTCSSRTTPSRRSRPREGASTR